jgi:hypothetical protein
VLGVKLFGSGKIHCLATFNGWLLKLFYMTVEIVLFLPASIDVDKIRTALRSYRCIVCPSVSPLSLPLTESSNSEKNAHVWSWYFPLLCSHSWIISHDLKWYKTSVVFTTVFHGALLSCRQQQSWIVSSVWILAPWLWLRCWLWDVQSFSISIPA